jgi:hypothetical protein
VLVAAAIGFLSRLAVGIALALVLAVLIALVREDGSFAESFRVAVLVVGCLMLLVAGAGHSPSARSGTIDPWLGSFFPKLMPYMTRQSTMRVSPTALFVLTAFVLFAIGLALG